MSATYLVTAPTFHRKRLFQNQRFGEVLTEILMQCRQQYDFLLHDYVIMPDHVHLLLTADADADIAGIVRSFRLTFTDQLMREFGYHGEIWSNEVSQRSIETAEDFAAVARHIHSNPVRGGFCEHEREYGMSSRSSRWVLDPAPEALRPALQSA